MSLSDLLLRKSKKIGFSGSTLPLDMVDMVSREEEGEEEEDEEKKEGVEERKKEDEESWTGSWY